MKHIIITLAFFIFSLSMNAQNEAAVELSQMNVVYRGINNPIKISVPNAKSFEAYAEGLRKIDSLGNYEMSPTIGLTVDIKIKGISISGDSIFKTKTLRIKNIGSVISTINNLGCKKCVLELTKEEVLSAKIGAVIPDFLFDAELEVTRFKIKLPNHSIIQITGNQIDNNTNSLIEELEIDDIIYIFDIISKFKKPQTFTACKFTPIKIRIVN